MKSYIGIAAAMLAGAAFGAVAVGGLHAQSKPGAYVVVDITEVSDPDTFKTLLPKAPGAVAAFAGQFHCPDRKHHPVRRHRSQAIYRHRLRKRGQSQSLGRISGPTGSRRNSDKVDEVALLHC